MGAKIGETGSTFAESDIRHRFPAFVAVVVAGLQGRIRDKI